MITFLEGLPRSGKTHCALKDSIIPALKNGRKVFAYIEGLNHSKIAELAGISIPKCCELLVQLEREQVREVWKIVQDDSLVVLDEVQNFWPAERQKLDEATTLFITEHGHHGLDIILMGQSMVRIHSQWRLLVERKIYYLKKTALGKPDEYTATFFTVVPRGKDVAFEQIQTIDYSYDKDIFGAYKSHTDGTKNKETAVDKRAVVWNTPLFKKWLPIFGLVFVVGVGYMIWFFTGGLASTVLKKPAPAAVVLPPLPLSPPPGFNRAPDVVQAPAAVPVSAPLPSMAAPVDLVEELNQKGRIRFLGYMRLGDRIKGFFEWRDSANNRLQSLTLLDLSGLGYVVMVNQTGTIATLTKGSTTITATAWPIDRADGRVSETKQQEIAGNPPGMVMASASDLRKPTPRAHLPGY